MKWLIVSMVTLIGCAAFGASHLPNIVRVPVPLALLVVWFWSAVFALAAALDDR